MPFVGRGDLAILGSASRLRGAPLLSLTPTVMLRTTAKRCAGCSRSLRRAYSTTQATHEAPAPPPPAARRGVPISTVLSVVALGLFGGYALGVAGPRPAPLAILWPVPTVPAPHKDTDEGRAATGKVEQGLQALAIVSQLRAERAAAESEHSSADSSLEKAADALKDAVSASVPAWRESRPYSAAEPGPHSFSGSTLRGPGKFAVPPLVFTSRDNKQGVFVLHLGDHMCGHEGIVHGGLLATLCDEALARTVCRLALCCIKPSLMQRKQAFLSLPSKLGVTANLNVSYRAPTFANQYVVLKTQLVSVKGRKAISKGRIETLDGQLLVEAE